MDLWFCLLAFAYTGAKNEHTTNLHLFPPLALPGLEMMVQSKMDSFYMLSTDPTGTLVPCYLSSRWRVLQAQNLQVAQPQYLLQSE